MSIGEQLHEIADALQRHEAATKDPRALADPRGLAPRDSWAGPAMASGAWWARVIQAARRFGGAR